MIGRSERLKYKSALVELLPAQKDLFHVVAELPPGASRAALEDSLYAWAARVDRHYVGRGWSRPHHRANRMCGLVFFETGRRGGHVHAHMIVAAPTPASPLHFLIYGRFFFQRQSEPCLRRCYPNPVSSRGQMHITRVGRTHADRRRVLNYVAKEIEGSEEAIGAWKFLDQLTPRHV